MNPFSPESRLLHVNQDKHKQHAALMVAPTSFASNFCNRFYNVDRVKHERLSEHRSIHLQRWTYFDKENSNIQKTYAQLSAIANEILEILKQNSSTCTKAKHAFQFQIHGIQNGLVDVSLDFSHSRLNHQSIKRTVKRITDLSAHNQLFSIRRCHLDQTKHLHMFLSHLNEEIMENPRTSDQTKRLIEEGKGDMFLATVTRKSNEYAMIPWRLSLDFSNSILNPHEIQYVLWRVLLMPEYMIRFEISALNFSNTSVNIHTLTEDNYPNGQYPEVRGSPIGAFLHLSITELNLNQSKISPVILQSLSQFPTLEKLYLNECIQDAEHAIKPQDVQEACPQLKLLETQKWIQKEGPEEKDDCSCCMWG